jgi:sulfite reductase (NADPH) hemoprotein beta-component
MRFILTHVSLKYTIDDMGLDEFKRQVEERLGRPMSAPRKHQPFTKNIDDFSGWVKGDDGLYSHTVFIENGILIKVDNLIVLGRVEDRAELRAKAGLLEIAEYMIKTKSGHFRLTGNQHVIVAGITSEQLPYVKELLAKYKLDNLNFSGLRLSSYSSSNFRANIA